MHVLRTLMSAFLEGVCTTPRLLRRPGQCDLTSLRPAHRPEAPQSSVPLPPISDKAALRGMMERMDLGVSVCTFLLLRGQ